MVSGTLYNGQSSKPQQVHLEEHGEFGLKLLIDNKTHVLTWDNIEVSTRLGNSARYIELRDYGRVETTDNDGVDQLIVNHPKYRRGNLLHKMENSYRWIAAALLVTVCFTFAMIKWGLPWLSDTIAYSLPEKTTTYLEDKVFEQFEKRFLQPSQLSTRRQAEIMALFDKVQDKFATHDKGYRFIIRDAEATIGANALAFPSGVIMMTDQLIELADNDTQIEGVLAHELGHLEQKHSMRQLIRGSLLTIAVAWISGDVSGTLSGVITAPVAILELSYSREFETEADDYSIRYFDCNHAKLEEMAALFAKMDGQFDDEESRSENASDTNQDFLSTHPATKKRMARLRQPHQHAECF